MVLYEDVTLIFSVHLQAYKTAERIDLINLLTPGMFTMQTISAMQTYYNVLSKMLKINV